MNRNRLGGTAVLNTVILIVLEETRPILNVDRDQREFSAEKSDHLRSSAGAFPVSFISIFHFSEFWSSEIL